MARTALWAPAHRILQRSALSQNYPGNAPVAAPSLDFLGQGFQDHRFPFSSGAGTAFNALGFQGAGSLCLVDQVPSTIATANIAALQNVTNGTPMTLVSSSGAGITVLPTGGQVWFPFVNTEPAGACVIDAGPAAQNIIKIGRATGGATGFYDPLGAISRAVSITGVASGTGGNFLITGFDYFGQTQSQLLTVGAGAVTATTTKTFKGVVSVVPQFTDAHNYSVGTGDVYGFPMAADFFAYVDIFWNNVLQAVATFTAAVTTAPSTTTGDVRGTFTPGSASNNTIRLQMFVTPSLARVNANTVWGLTPV